MERDLGIEDYEYNVGEINLITKKTHCHSIGFPNGILMKIPKENNVFHGKCNRERPLRKCFVERISPTKNAMDGSCQKKLHSYGFLTGFSNKIFIENSNEFFFKKHFNKFLDLKF